MELNRSTEWSLRDLGAKVLKPIIIGTALFFVYTGWSGPAEAMIQRGILVGVALVATFILYPLGNKTSIWLFIIDCVISALSVFTVTYIVWLQPKMFLIKMEPSQFDLVACGILIVLVLEATRRVSGWSVLLVALSVLLFAYFGEHMPGVFNNPGFSIERIADALSLSTFGIWGVPVAVCSKVIVLFVIFASFLQTGGATEAFMEIPKASFGRFRGGTAKIAVVASALFGTFSGSATANVVGTGVFTIPMMKRAGYRPAMAGAVEALASTGGQFMPPVMGAGAFIMAELLQISYWDVCIAAALPAFLFYVAIFTIVDIEAAKTGLKGIPREQLPSFWKVLAQYWPMLVPLVCLIYFMAVAGVSVMRASLYSIIAMVAVSWFRKETRMGLKKIFIALENGMRMMMMVTIVCACAGIIIGSLYLTGIGIQISTQLVKLSHGLLPLLLVLTALVTIILGMGMPTTAVYLFTVFIIAPAMAELKVPMLAAHLFLFIFGALGAITPPVCIASFAAAAIAEEGPFKVGWTAFGFGIIGFIVPFMFVFNPVLIMQGTPGEIILSTVTAMVGVVAFAIMLQGHLLHSTKKLERVCFGLGGIFLLKPGLITDLIGGALITAALISQVISRRKEKKLASKF